MTYRVGSSTTKEGSVTTEAQWNLTKKFRLLASNRGYQHRAKLTVKNEKANHSGISIICTSIRDSVLNGACCGWAAWDYPDCILHGTSLNYIYNGNNPENCDLGTAPVFRKILKMPSTSGVPRLGHNLIQTGALFSAA